MLFPMKSEGELSLWDNYLELKDTSQHHASPLAAFTYKKAPWEFHSCEKCDLCLVCFFSSVPSYRTTLLCTGSISWLSSCRWKWIFICWFWQQVGAVQFFSEVFFCYCNLPSVLLLCFGGCSANRNQGVCRSVLSHCWWLMAGEKWKG